MLISNDSIDKNNALPYSITNPSRTLKYENYIILLNIALFFSIALLIIRP